MAVHGRVLGAFRALNGWTHLIALPLIGVTASAWGVRAAAAVIAGIAISTGVTALTFSRAGLAGTRAGGLGPPLATRGGND